MENKQNITLDTERIKPSKLIAYENIARIQSAEECADLGQSSSENEYDDYIGGVDYLLAGLAGKPCPIILTIEEKMVQVFLSGLAH